MIVMVALAAIWGVSVAAFGWVMWVEVIRPEFRFRRVERERNAEDSQVADLDSWWALPSFDPEALA